MIAFIASDRRGITFIAPSSYPQVQISNTNMQLQARPVFAAKPVRAATVKVHASWQKATTKTALSAAGGKLVAELGGQASGGRRRTSRRACARPPVCCTQLQHAASPCHLIRQCGVDIAGANGLG